MLRKAFTKLVDVEPAELRALWLGFAFHFLILTGYYITKPIRDSIGASNMEALPWMFTRWSATIRIHPILRPWPPVWPAPWPRRES